MEQLAPALGLQVREAEIGLAQFEAAEEVFYCNALVGVCPVGSFAGSRWQRHNTCEALHQLLCQGGQ
jgi:branched-subunit amino acid aminotransferase/4-amino-4-deoxychorismate lyase